MLSRLAQALGSGRERGQVAVFFALLIPVFFGLGAIVLDVGNWYVHKRHLQTQVDAAALSTAPHFVGCSPLLNPAGANAAIEARAIEYSGDATRAAALAVPFRNPQVQEPNDVHVTLNSQVYWSSGDPMDDSLDNTLDTNGDGLGDPCNESAVEVRATDDDAPLLWGLIPLSTSPKARARVEIRQLRSTAGMLPLAVPEVDPKAVAAIFVNEFDGSVLAALELIPGSCPDPTYPYACWAVDFPSVEINTDNVGVVVLVSRENPDPSLAGTLTQICTQPGAPDLIRCYQGDGNEDGISVIYGYPGGGNGSLQNPIVRNVQLFDVNCAAGGDHSSPYFVVTADCTVGIRAEVDVGIHTAGPPNPAAFPNCVEVTSTEGALSFDSHGGVGSIFTGSFTLAANDPGRNRIDLTVRTRNPARNNCSQQLSASFPKVAVPYFAGDDSGVVDYITVENLSAPFGLANSIEKNSTPRPLRVTVGLQRPLELLDAREPPQLLRFASRAGALNQTLDCDGYPGSNFEAEFAAGCVTNYQINYDDFDGDGTDEWADIDCSAYPFGNGPPPDPVNNPFPNCIARQPGVSVGQFRQGLDARFESPCTPNNWPSTTATDDEVRDFFLNYDFSNDPRYVTLVIADFTAFEQSGPTPGPRPIKKFGGFYVTGWGTGGVAQGCAGNDAHPLGLTGSRAQFDMWGHYVQIVVFSGSGTPTDDLCAFGQDPGVCIAVLVE